MCDSDNLLYAGEAVKLNLRYFLFPLVYIHVVMYSKAILSIVQVWMALFQQSGSAAAGQ